ncbi:MAG TPA: type 4a pilus biogenesis protein PilO [Terriglobia bacterium]|nr:type 4a pilus biogenesis protein PilO [Terriglobia bacterium]
MKAKYKRQRQQYLFAGALGVFAVINLLFFLILYAPARSDYYELRDAIGNLQNEVSARQKAVERLEKLNAQLETSEQDRRRLFTKHFLPRDIGYSQILPKLDAMAQDAGVLSTRKGFTIDEAPQYGLYSVKITVPVTGGYANVVRFIKELETADTFFITNSIDVRGTDTSTAANSEISLDVKLETFFYQ